MSDVSQEKFEQRWESHVEELNGLAWNLDGDDRTRLYELTDELGELVETAAENYEGDQ